MGSLKVALALAAVAAEIDVVYFAGAGGSSEAYLQAIGKHPDVALNHNDTALAVHAVMGASSAMMRPPAVFCAAGWARINLKAPGKPSGSRPLRSSQARTGWQRASRALAHRPAPSWTRWSSCSGRWAGRDGRSDGLGAVVRSGAPRGAILGELNARRTTSDTVLEVQGSRAAFISMPAAIRAVSA